MTRTEKIGAKIRPAVVTMFILIAAAGLALRLYGLNDRVLFADEAYTHWTAVMPAAQTVAASAGERTPPLTGLIINAWLRVFPRDSIFWLRLPFVIFNMLVLLPLFALGRRLAGDFEALAACALFALSPAMIDMSQFARYPSLEILLFTTAAMCIFEYRDTGRALPLIGFVVSAALVYFTHYFAIVIACAFGLSILLFVKGRERIFLIGGLAASFAPFAPWAPNFLGRTGSEVGFVGMHRALEYMQTKPYFAIPHILQGMLIGGWPVERASIPLFALLVLGTAAAFITFVAATKRRRDAWFLALVVLLPLFCAMAMKTLLDFPINAFERIASPLAPLFFLGLAAGWNAMPRRYAAAAALPLAVALAFSLHFYITTLNTTVNANTAMRAVARQNKTGDVLLTLPPDCDILVHFFGLYGMPRIGIPSSLDPLRYNAISRRNYPTVDDTYIARLGESLKPYKRAWVFWCGGDHPALDSKGRVLDFMNDNYKTAESMNFAIISGHPRPGGGLLKLYELKK